MKRLLTIALSLLLVIGLFAGCASTNNDSETSTPAGTGSADTEAPTTEAPSINDNITVVSREEGSGTRGAFIELMGIEVDDVDQTTDMAEVTSSTAVAMQTVAGNESGIGYISLGSLDDSVKALKVDGVEATVENIKGDSYAVARPFNLATKGELSDVAQDFMDFIMSDEGQAIVDENGYISVSEGQSYEGSGMSGTVALAGSTSVSPLMEHIAEAYKELNPDVSVEIQQSGSSAGMTSAMEGACDIGMASRGLKDSELEVLTPIVMAMDGIAVIVNNANSIDSLPSEQIRQIFVGEITKWSEANG